MAYQSILNKILDSLHMTYTLLSERPILVVRLISIIPRTLWNENPRDFILFINVKDLTNVTINLMELN